MTVSGALELRKLTALAAWQCHPRRSSRCCYAPGLRVGELPAADVADLGYDRGHRTLTVTRKGGKRQHVALPPPATGRLDAYLSSSRT